MRPNVKQALLSGSFEGFFVVLGVVLALALNQWRELSARQERAAIALDAVLREIDANRAALQTSFDYHNELLGLMRKRTAAEEPLALSDFPKGFIGPASVLRVAWDAAAATATLEDLRLEAMIRLGRLYAEQDDYVQQARISGNIIFEDIYRSGPKGVIDGSNDLPSLIGTFWFTEKKLLGVYEDTRAEVRKLRESGAVFR